MWSVPPGVHEPGLQGVAVEMVGMHTELEALTESITAKEAQLLEAEKVGVCFRYRQL